MRDTYDSLITTLSTALIREQEDDVVAVNYPLSPQGVFRTIQGEGALLGTPMTFVRLAGCSVGCPNCDTNYRVAQRMELDDIVKQVVGMTPRGGWVWLTGGEPTDHDIEPLVDAIRGVGRRVAVATSGHKQIQCRPDFLSVSPHDYGKWVQRSGDELKLVPGLNDLNLTSFEKDLVGIRTRFTHLWVSPCDGQQESVRQCQEWVERHPEWRMTTQAHKRWNLL